MAHRFSLIRFVPDAARGEFVNIGALAGDDETGDWELRVIQNFTRAKAIDTQGHLGAALAFLANLEASIAAIGQIDGTEEAEPMSVGLLERMSVEMRNLVQLTAPSPLVADSASGALDRIFAELLVDPAGRRFRFDKKTRAVSSTLAAYRHREIPEDSIRRRVAVSAGAFADDFDFAIVNGEALQLVQCWSFQLPNQADLAEEIRAWAWMVHELKTRGGLVQAGPQELEIPGDAVEIAAVYVEPAKDQAVSHAFDEAQAVFEEVDVVGVPYSQAEVIADRAVSLLSRAA